MFVYFCFGAVFHGSTYVFNAITVNYHHSYSEIAFTSSSKDVAYLHIHKTQSNIWTDVTGHLMNERPLLKNIHLFSLKCFNTLTTWLLTLAMS